MLIFIVLFGHWIYIDGRNTFKLIIIITIFLLIIIWIKNPKLSILEEKLYQKQVLNLKWVVIHLKLQTPIHT